MDPQSSPTVKALAPEQYGSIAGEPRAHRRDAAVVVLLGIGAAFAFSHFELSEAILAWTQPHERFQLDGLIPGWTYSAYVAAPKRFIGKSVTTFTIGNAFADVRVATGEKKDLGDLIVHKEEP